MIILSHCGIFRDDTLNISNGTMILANGTRISWLEYNEIANPAAAINR
jgi:hypothetical protein